MRKMRAAILPVLLLLAACEPAREPEFVVIDEPPPLDNEAEEAAPGTAPADRPGGPRWEEALGGGPALHLLGRDGALRLSIACLPAPPRLVVHAPDFTSIGSEERFALAIGGEPVTLVADPSRQPAADGITADGPIPRNLRALWRRAGRIGASYGSQQIGPEEAPERAVSETFLAGCERLRG